MKKCGFVHLISLCLIAMRPQRNDYSCKTLNLFYEGLVVSRKSFLRPDCGTREQQVPCILRVCQYYDMATQECQEVYQLKQEVNNYKANELSCGFYCLILLCLKMSETDRCSHSSCHTDVASAMKTKQDYVMAMNSVIRRGYSIIIISQNY